MALEKEYKVYEENRQKFIGQGHTGKFVVIKEDEILDIFLTYEDALRQGIKKYGNVSFLIKKISSFEEVNFFFHGIDIECPA